MRFCWSLQQILALRIGDKGNSFFMNTVTVSVALLVWFEHISEWIKLHSYTMLTISWNYWMKPYAHVDRVIYWMIRLNVSRFLKFIWKEQSLSRFVACIIWFKGFYSMLEVLITPCLVLTMHFFLIQSAALLRLRIKGVKIVLFRLLDIPGSCEYRVLRHVNCIMARMISPLYGTLTVGPHRTNNS